VWIERKEIPRLVAKVDSENIASQRILMRIRARKGEVLKDWYALARDGGRKRDIECWYIDRPRVDAEPEQDTKTGGAE
jgi:RimJ/RimL family protein N-acetyltransferase